MSKLHYIADKSLGGIDREYVESDRKPSAGDFVLISRYNGENVSRIGRLITGGLKEGSFTFEYADGTSYDGHYLAAGQGDEFYALSPTDIIRHNGERYRLVSDRKAKDGDKIISHIGNGNNGLTAGNTYDVLEVFEDTVCIDDDEYEDHDICHENYSVIEPIKSELDTADLVIRLSQTVADLEKRLKAAEQRVIEADYKAGQALTTASQLSESPAGAKVTVEVELDGHKLSQILAGTADE